MSNIEPDRNNLAQASPRQVAFGKQVSFGQVAAIFLLVGPPIFWSLFFAAIAFLGRNSDPFHTRIAQSLGLVSGVYGLPAAYIGGVVPSLIAGFAYSKSRRHQRTTGRRLLVAALIGAALYFLICVLVVYLFDDGRTHAWPFYAAGAGAISAFICALIVEA